MAAPAWYRFDAGTNTLTLCLHVQPGAKRTEVAGFHGAALKIKLAAPPVEGRANQALADFLAAHFRVPLSQVSLVKGSRSRAKVARISAPARGPETLLPAAKK